MQSSMGPTNEFVEVDGAALIENFGSTMRTLDAMLATAPSQPGGLDIDTVEVSLSMSADGKVAFASSRGLPMAASSSLKLTLRRRTT